MIMKIILFIMVLTAGLLLLFKWWMLKRNRYTWAGAESEYNYFGNFFAFFGTIVLMVAAGMLYIILK